MPTKTVGCSSMTLPCKCGHRPERLSGFRTVALRAATCSVAGLRARGKHGLTLTVQPRGHCSSGQLKDRRRSVGRSKLLESVRAAAKRDGVSPTTMQKCCARQTTTDATVGPKEPRSMVPAHGDRPNRAGLSTHVR